MFLVMFLCGVSSRRQQRRSGTRTARMKRFHNVANSFPMLSVEDFFRSRGQGPSPHTSKGSGQAHSKKREE
jgi:hypothetical protein